MKKRERLELATVLRLAQDAHNTELAAAHTQRAIVEFDLAAAHAEIAQLKAQTQTPDQNPSPVALHDGYRNIVTDAATELAMRMHRKAQDQKTMDEDWTAWLHASLQKGNYPR